MTLGIGFIGCGLIANSHAQRLETVAEAAIVSCFDIDADRMAAFASTFGAVQAKSFDEVISASDAVYVTTWTSEHRELVEAVVAQGKPVFCEKPLGVNLADAQAIHDAVQASGVVNQVGLVLRHSPAFRWMQHHVNNAADHGEPMSLLFRDDQYIPVQGMYGSTWRADVAKAGAGTLLEHSIHDLDLIEWIFGRIVRVSCTTMNLHGHPGIEDQATVMLTADHGGSAVLSSTWHDVLSRPSQRYVEAFCQNACIRLAGDWHGPVGLVAGSEPDAEWSGGDLASMADTLDGRGTNPDADFVRKVIAGTPAYPDFSVALRAHVLADAAYRSAAAGGTPIDL